MSFIVLIFLLFWLLKRYRSQKPYNPYDEHYSHSSYPELTWIRPDKQVDRICEILDTIAGHKHLMRGVVFSQDAVAEVLMIHETGIYVVSDLSLEGTIRGGFQDRYWTEEFRKGRFTGCRNYFYNPFLANKRSMDRIKWALKDMPQIPYYSFAVFEGNGYLETAGQMSEGCWAVTLQGFAGTLGEVTRHNRKFLKPELVEEIYSRVCKLVQDGGRTGIGEEDGKTVDSY